ncbi:hypothetical protein DFJ77DRAFT_174600 [Powellomyces hirtus]|nr:hypothetical protein DFJ77DRAFT_174600 [Powellomyces hirtus]
MLRKVLDGAASGNRILSKRTQRILAICLLFVLVVGLLSTSVEYNGTSGVRFSSPLNGGAVKTVGVFVEGRALQNMVPIILYFAGYLGPSWPIHVFHSQDNAHLLKASGAIGVHVKRGTIVLHEMDTPKINFKNHEAVSEFLTDPWIWETLVPATHALLFQADSILCSNSNLRPEDFLQYAFIGAPIAPVHGVGYNGGLSLRHIPTVLRTIKQFNFRDAPLPEDQWFATYIPKLTNPPAPPLPTIEEAKYFSSETIWVEKAMGYHQAKRWNPDKMPLILDWCPEITLAEEGLLWKLAEKH